MKEVARKRNTLVCGVGTNDADYKISNYLEGKQVWCCPFYVKWKSMLKRCYSKSQYPSYSNCIVVKDWHYFTKFKSWMETQDWEGKHLDKDILFPGNKEYGPETCIFIDSKVNTFIIESNASRGSWPIGVCFQKPNRKYRAWCWAITTGKPKSLGLYNTPEEAHSAWLTFKLKQAYIIASEQSDQRVAKALINRYENYITLGTGV